LHGTANEKAIRSDEEGILASRAKLAKASSIVPIKRPGDAPFGSKIEEYMTARTSNGNGLRERSAIETRRYLEQYFKPLHNMALAEIRRIDVANVLSEINRPLPTIAHGPHRPSSLLGPSARDGVTIIRLWGPSRKIRPESASGFLLTTKLRRCGSARTRPTATAPSLNCCR
jgi:hypothetical protein